MVDQQLLRQFVSLRDESAFAELVRRHGAMVLDAAGCVLHNRHDAEDVFQATFLVLTRKAGSIRKQTSLASWLYGVAYRLARKAKVGTAKRKAREHRSIQQCQSTGMDEMTWRELRQVLHEELHRLSGKYQAPLILCYFEGKTQDEAAHQLGWNKWTLKDRLERGRDLLRKRLMRRGLIPSATFFATLLLHDSASAVPAALVDSTLNAGILFATCQGAGSSISTQAARLAEQGMRSMAFTKARLTMALVLTFAMVAGGAGLAAYKAKKENPPQERRDFGESLVVQVKDPSPAPKETPPRTDRYGDPLPAGAIARLGTARFRHGDNLSSIGISPDGKQIISQSDVVRVWEAATGKELRHFSPFPLMNWPGRRLGSGSLSPDGKVLAVGDMLNESDAIILCELATGRKLKGFGGKGQYEVVSFSPDGKTLGAIASRRGRIELWDAATGQQLHAWDAHGQAYSVAFAPDGKTLLTHGRDKRVCLWDVATGRLTREIKDCPTVWNFQDPHNQVVISPDGSHLAAIRPKEDNETMPVNQIGIWDVATAKEVCQLKVAQEEIASANWSGCWALAWASNGQLVTAGPDASIRIWDPVAARQVRRIRNASPFSLAVSRDAKHVVAGGQTIRVIDLTKDPLSDFPADVGAPGPPGEVAVNGGLAVTTHGYAVLWDAATGNELRRLQHPSGIARVHLSADDRVLFAACGDNILRAWDTATGREKRDFELKNGTPRFLRAVLGDAATTLAPTPDDKVLLAAARPNAEIDVWNAVTGKIARTFKGRQCHVYAMAFTPEARTLVICFEDRTVEVWDVASGKKLRQFSLPEDKEHNVPVNIPVGKPVFTAALSPDGKLLAFGSQDRFLVLKDMVTGQDVRRLDKLPDGVCPLAFSPDGKTLAWAGWQDPTVHLVEVLTGRERCTLHGHGGRVLGLAFSGDEKRLISASTDTTALVWDLSGRLSAGDRWDKPLSLKEIEAAWVDLSGDEAARAYQAICRLAGSSTEAVSFLQKCLQPIAIVDEKRLGRLVADLDSDSFAVRQRAMSELEKLGEVATTMCRKALEEKPSAEMRRRLEALLKEQRRDKENPSPDRLRALRAIETLEHMATPEARRVLATLAQGAPEARLTQEAHASLERLTKTVP
jgi:RNA polymerase sigma factor (sigma-70 family)